MGSGLSRRVPCRALTEPDFRARSGNHINRVSKFAVALPTVIFPSWNSVETLDRRPVNIIFLLRNPTPSDAAWRSFATRWRLGLVSRRLAGQETHHIG